MKNPVTDQLITEIKSQIKPSPSGKRLAFLKDYYHRLSTQDFDKQNVGFLYDAAVIHHRLASKRSADQILVRIDNVLLPDESSRTLISIVTSDSPFLISSLTLNLNKLNYRVERTIHPLFQVQRTAKGTLSSLQRYRSGDVSANRDQVLESFIQFELDVVAKSDHAALASALHQVIANISVITGDWTVMRDAALSVAERVEQSSQGPAFAEYGTLLRWMAEDHFAFLGYCELTLRGGKKGSKNAIGQIDTDSLCGILRAASINGDDPHDILPPVVQSKTSPVVFTKSNQRIYIHRANYPDCILIEHDFDKKSGKKGQRKVSCFIGFLAGTTATMAIRDIPHLRNKAAFILSESSLREGSYAYKELRTILETLPREMIFQLSSKALYGLCMTLLNQQERRRTRLHLNRNLSGHFYSCLVYIPRDLFNSHLRQRISDYLQQELKGREVTFNVYFSDSILIRIYYTIFCDAGSSTRATQQELEKHVQDMANDFNEKLLIEAREQYGIDAGSKLARTWLDSFSASYQETYEPQDALDDIARFEALDDQQIKPRLVLSSGDHPSTHFRLYSDQTSVPLSDVLPILDDMGVRVLSEHPYHIQRKDGKDFYINDFVIVRQDGKLFAKDLAQRFEQAFTSIWFGFAESDKFNQLVLLAGFDWRQVNMVRGYVRYLKQVRLRYSENYVTEALLKNPELITALGDLFDCRFNPERKSRPVKRLHNKIQRMLDQVQTLDEERIFSAILDVMNATLRCNYYQVLDGEFKTYISFKLDSGSIPRIPEPAPKYEIFVYSPRVEGVHLRGGEVARGGLRWSERPEDFRTEVLGLVKAQRVKNAVIVPVGSKGGFVAKNLPEGPRDAIQEEVVACYKLFISALLDVTDNIVDGKIVPPANVVRADGDDPYLVVAADKGTATFSDIANGLSGEYGFWLGDAFASGGSAGYDHKKMGITARGAWESVKRHFRELGKDIQTEPFTAIGIGDMAGDVFGNGMLLSKKTKLVAAFNHMHIFIDPDPNPATSYKERKRLFHLPRSSWADYNQKLISRGGGIFERSAKSIKLSPQAKKALSAKHDNYTPTELINVILKAKLELLWNGGIGTYVKASSETHQDAQDRSNDSVRVDANQLNVKVIGEGGNLGVTQLARIEFNQHGGLCYTDAIDNSAGVDTSDHEVNIKILLNASVQAGQLTMRARNKLLARMEDEVGRLVLHNNYIQTQTVSMEANYGEKLMTQQMHSISALEQRGLLAREIEFLPDNQTLRARRDAGQWLTRAELSVLLSYSKMELYQKLLASSVPDDKYLAPEIEHYFPAVLVKKYSEQMQQHRLRREIISTSLTNDMVGKLGPNFHFRVSNLTSSSTAEVVSAYVVAREILGLEEVHQLVRNIDNKVPADIQQDILWRSMVSAESVIVWLLRQISSPLDISATVNRFIKPMVEVNKAISELISSDQSILDEKCGLTAKQRKRIDLIGYQAYACDIVDAHLKTRQSVSMVTQVYFRAARQLGFDWIVDAIGDLTSNNDWNLRARFSLGETLRSVHGRLVNEILLGSKAKTAEARVDSWMKQNQAHLESIESMVGELRDETVIDFAMLSVLISELNLIGEEAKAA